MWAGSPLRATFAQPQCSPHAYELSKGPPLAPSGAQPLLPCLSRRPPAARCFAAYPPLWCVIEGVGGRREGPPGPSCPKPCRPPYPPLPPGQAQLLEMERRGGGSQRWVDGRAGLAALPGPPAKAHRQPPPPSVCRRWNPTPRQSTSPPHPARRLLAVITPEGHHVQVEADAGSPGARAALDAVQTGQTLLLDGQWTPPAGGNPSSDDSDGSMPAGLQAAPTTGDDAAAAGSTHFRATGVRIIGPAPTAAATVLPGGAGRKAVLGGGAAPAAARYG